MVPMVVLGDFLDIFYEHRTQKTFLFPWILMADSLVNNWLRNIHRFAWKRFASNDDEDVGLELEKK